MDELKSIWLGFAAEPFTVMTRAALSAVAVVNRSVPPALSVIPFAVLPRCPSAATDRTPPLTVMPPVNAFEAEDRTSVPAPFLTSPPVVFAVMAPEMSVFPCPPTVIDPPAAARSMMPASVRFVVPNAPLFEIERPFV
jgi:hypothetical protein